MDCLDVGSRETIYQIALTLSSGVPRLIEMPEPKPSVAIWFMCMGDDRRRFGSAPEPPVHSVWENFAYTFQLVMNIRASHAMSLLLL
jgi:hypothetical protein